MGPRTEQTYIPNPRVGMSWEDVCGESRRTNDSDCAVDLTSGLCLLVERQSREMAVKPELLGSAAGPSELAEGSEGWSTSYSCSQWPPHSCLPSLGLTGSCRGEGGKLCPGQLGGGPLHPQLAPGSLCAQLS